MLKNSIESADYFDIRILRYDHLCSYERRLNLMQTGFGASTMAVFHHAGLCPDNFISGCKVK
jgi:hypothetical protein